MAKFLTPDEARASSEQRHKRYMADHCCHWCGGSTCTCEREMFWHPELEGWPMFWAKFQEAASAEPRKEPTP